MKQTFASLQVDRATLAARIEALRENMRAQNLDGFLIPHDNEWLTEYLSPHDERLAFISGFTGSAGVALVLRDRAVLWTDGRYQLQAQRQTDSLFELCHSGRTPLTQWLKENLEPKQRIGFDPKLHTLAGAQALIKAVTMAAAAGAATAVADNLIDQIWTKQPAPPNEPLNKYDVSFAGKSSAEKITALAAQLEGCFVISDPHSLAWILNVRGKDIPHTPITLCYGLLYPDGTFQLFIDEARLNEETRAHLSHIQLCPPAIFAETLGGLKKVQLDKNKTSYWIYQQVEAAEITFIPDPCLLPKAAKNKTELAGMRQAHIRDGAALTQFLFWLPQQGGIDEITATKKLEHLRTQQNLFFDISFDTIAGSGAHGAIVHYRVDEASNRTLQDGELFLVDSGGQYLDGTTDITRTLAYGTPSREQQENFTRVLQGHIALARAVFPKGTSGAQLDVLARRPLWQAGLDFDHGTGHGVGAFLSVHEGPQGISPRGTATPLCEGMIISNEPGFYKEGEYGIRIENLVAVVAKNNFLGFETISCAPIDKALILAAWLDDKERRWLNNYHAWVCETLSPLLPPPCAQWLRSATSPI